jgi:Protein of unknown function (DUF3431)
VINFVFNMRRPAVVLAVFSFALLVATWRLFLNANRWRSIPQRIGLGDILAESEGGNNTTAQAESKGSYHYYRPGGLAAPPFNISAFEVGVPKKQGAKYSKTLVIAQLKEDNTTWTQSEEMVRSGWEIAAYVVDDPHAPLRPPKNKGHEAMVYLTYIIDNYDDLPDIMAFMHAHQFAWHNEDIFNFDASEMLRRLSLERVTRQGYMNMRCLWSPGCPNWLHPGAINQDGGKKEESIIAEAWSEMFPDMPVPQVLSQPCCAQFALSRERVRAIPRERYVYYREWLLHTELRDSMSGRVWEYLWHVVFTGQEVSCPSPNACLCDGFGICFGGDDKVRFYYETLWRIRDATNELGQWQEEAGALDEDARIKLSLDEMANAEPAPDDNHGILLMAEVEEKTAQLVKLKKQALEKGGDPVLRAWAAGRVWKAGDGY